MSPKTSGAGTRCLLKWRRELAGVSQQALAQRVGVSRQTLISIEAERQIPSTSLSLQIARALGCRVEDIFVLVPGDEVEFEVAPPQGPLDTRAPTSRLIAGRVRDRWVGHPLRDADVTADAVVIGAAPESKRQEGLAPGRGAHRGRRRKNELAGRLLDGAAEVSGNVLVAGCAPLLGALSGCASRRYRDMRIRWLADNSHRALDLLKQDLVHIAGIHLFDEATGQENVPFVHERFPGEDMLVVNLTLWRQGIVVQRGNPLGIRRCEDLARPGLRFAGREKGAGATRLLQSSIGDDVALPTGPLARSHRQVAQLVECKAADAGIAVESVALAAGLDFVPLSEERFDLVVRKDTAGQGNVARALDMLEDSVFRTEVGALPGYDSSIAGQTRLIACE